LPTLADAAQTCPLPRGPYSGRTRAAVLLAKASSRPRDAGWVLTMPGHHRLGIGGIKRRHVLHVADRRTDREVRKGRVFRSRASQIAGLGLGILDEVLAKTHRHRFLALVDAAGQHHVDHPRLADKVGHPDRRAAAGEKAPLAFGQGEIGAGVGHPDMRRRGKFQPAADDRALQRGNDRDTAVFHLVERLVPAQTDVHELRRAAVFPMVFDKIEPRAEMRPLGAQDHRADPRARHQAEKRYHFLDRGRV